MNPDHPRHARHANPILSSFLAVWRSGAVRITLIYLVFGCLWIFGSDQIALMIYPYADTEFYQTMQTGKGWFFILATAGLLYVLISRHIAVIEGQRRQIEDSYERTLIGWVQALDLRDRETEAHTRRVTDLTLTMAREMGLEDDIEDIRRGALLHDIGKMGVPDAILNKPGPLTLEEMDVMRRHPKYAQEWLSTIPYLEPALDIPYSHHERWDGTGYPQGLKEDQIPLAARLFAVADVWDALTSRRPYREALPERAAAAYLRAHAGSHFDPEVVEKFLEVILGREESEEGAGERREAV